MNEYDLMIEKKKKTFSVDIIWNHVKEIIDICYHIQHWNTGQ